MKLNQGLGICLFVLMTLNFGYSFDITGTAPTISVQDPVAQLALPQFETTMNATLATAFNNTIDTAKKNLSGFKELKNLAEGFANANAYSINSASLQGFQNYSLFALAGGLMVGVQAPSPNVSYYSKIADDIQKQGDLYAGIGASVSFFNLGLNAKFIMPGLYLNAKYGTFARNVGDFKMDFQVMGVGFNYRLIDTKSLIGFVKWRGISLGSGFYMQSDKLNLKIDADTVKTLAPFRANVLATATNHADSLQKGILMDQLGYDKNNPEATLSLNPSFTMGLDVNTYTIPFDAVTSVSLFFGLINLTAGLGMDLNFGTNKIILSGETGAGVTSDSTKIKFNPAKVKIDGNGSAGPSATRFRAMTGAGIGLGPIKLDVPVIYYPASGFAFGATVAVVW